MLTNNLRFPALVVASLALFAPASPAQDDKPRLLLGDSINAPRASLERLSLRPNVGQRPLYVFVNNPTPVTKNVAVELVVNGEPVPGLRIKTAARPDAVEQVKFKEVAPMSAAPKDAATKPAAGDSNAGWQELKNATDKLEFRLVDEATSKELDRVTLSPEVMTPAQYLQVSEAIFYPAGEGKENYLTMKLKARNEFRGPECKVELVLSPERIPALKPGNAPGSIYQRTLAKAGQEVELIARDLQFKDAVSATGTVCITVDGWPRAFLYQATFPRAGGQVNLRALERPMLRVATPRYAAPGPIAFRIESDNPPAEPGLQTEVSLGRDRNGRFESVETKQLAGPKDQRVRFTAAKDGGLTFKASVQDWSDVLDVPAAFGEYQVRARMGGRQPVESPTETVTLADSKPDGLQLDVPDKPVRGKALAITAKCRQTPLPIKSVVFFVGKPVDDKAPRDVVVATPMDDDKTTWKGELVIQPDQKITDVSAQFINVLDRHAFKTTTVEFADPPQESTTGSIKGKVTNKRDDPQPDTTVILMVGDKKEKKAETKTNDKGEFEFKDLAPGSYVITAERKAAQTKGMGTAKVEKGKPTQVKIEISRF